MQMDHWNKSKEELINELNILSEKYESLKISYQEGLTEITERKRYEAEILKAKTEAENANLAKSEFLSSMSHEIRTPMNAILGYSELLESTFVNPTQMNYLESIRSSGRTLLTLINDILDLSKIEAGKLQLELDFINTKSFFSDFDKVFAFKVSEK